LSDEEKVKMGSRRAVPKLTEGGDEVESAPSRSSSAIRELQKGKSVVGLKARLLAYLELVRPHNVLAAVICVLLGMAASYKVAGYTFNIADALAASLVVALVSAGGYAINDYFDYMVDLVNKPYRPIPSGRVSPKEALAFSVALGAVGVALSTWFGYVSVVFVLLNAVLVYAYSAKIKELGIVGNVVVSFEGSASIVYGSLVASLSIGRYEILSASVIPTIIAFVLLLGREIVKTIEDYYADSVRGVRSLPRVLGLRKSALIASIILLSVVPLSFLPYFSGIYDRFVYAPLATLTIVLIVLSVARMLRSSNIVSAAAKVRSILKVSIITGILALLLSLIF